MWAANVERTGRHKWVKIYVKANAPLLFGEDFQSYADKNRLLFPFKWNEI